MISGNKQQNNIAKLEEWKEYVDSTGTKSGRHFCSLFFGFQCRPISDVTSLHVISRTGGQP